MLDHAWKGVVALLVLGAACGPPTITEGPRALPSPAEMNQAIQLHLRAVDAAGTELLSYAWTQEPASPAGSFSDASARAPTWTAPAVTTSTAFTLRVAVVDRKGQRTSDAVQVLVRPAKPRGNTPPVFVELPSSTPASARAGDTVTLTALAQDADGHPLTYAWRLLSPADAPGTFVTGPAGASVQWFSPEVGAGTDFTFEVSVSDGQGPPVRQHVTVPVRVPRYAEDIQPLWDGLCLGCHGHVQAAKLDLAAGRSHASLVGAPAYAGKCKKRPRVKPGDPDGSTLVSRLAGEDCGVRMPYDEPEHFDDLPGELVRIRSWIRAGAAKD